MISDYGLFCGCSGLVSVPKLDPEALIENITSDFS